jgi:hypothetical protein
VVAIVRLQLLENALGRVAGCSSGSIRHILKRRIVFCQNSRRTSNTNSAPSVTLSNTSASTASRAGGLELLKLCALLAHRTRWCKRSPPSEIGASFRHGWRMKAEVFRQRTGKTHQAGLILRTAAGDSDIRRDTIRRSGNRGRTAGIKTSLRKAGRIDNCRSAFFRVGQAKVSLRPLDAWEHVTSRRDHG